MTISDGKDKALKKIIGVGIAACLIISIIFMILDVDRSKDDNSSDKEEVLTNILTDNDVIDLRNHIVAYRTSSAQKLNRWAEGE